MPQPSPRAARPWWRPGSAERVKETRTSGSGFRAGKTKNGRLLLKLPMESRVPANAIPAGTRYFSSRGSRPAARCCFFSRSGRVQAPGGESSLHRRTVEKPGRSSIGSARASSDRSRTSPSSSTRVSCSAPHRPSTPAGRSILNLPGILEKPGPAQGLSTRTLASVRSSQPFSVTPAGDCRLSAAAGRAASPRPGPLTRARPGVR